MKRLFYSLFSWLMVLISSACAAAQQTEVPSTPTFVPVSATLLPTHVTNCKNTFDDGVSPSYRPDAPERNVVGTGHVLTGVVRSSVDCQPIPHAKLEFWPEEEGVGHSDSSRATFFSDENGRYRFECNPPEHIHMRISAPGYRTIGVNSYHPEGRPDGVFDFVLVPE